MREDLCGGGSNLISPELNVSRPPRHELLNLQTRGGWMAYRNIDKQDDIRGGGGQGGT